VTPSREELVGAIRHTAIASRSRARAPGRQQRQEVVDACVTIAVDIATACCSIC